MKRTLRTFAYFIALPITGVGLSQAYVEAQTGTLVEPAQTRPAQTAPVPTNAVPTNSAQGQPQGQPQEQQSTKHEAIGSMDRMIVHCMNLAAQEEIALAKFAQQKSHNQEVRAFAEHLIKDCSDAAKQLPQQYLTRNQAQREQIDVIGNDSETNNGAVPNDNFAETPDEGRATLSERLAGVIDAIEGEQRSVLKPAIPGDEVVQEEVTVLEERPLLRAAANVAANAAAVLNAPEHMLAIQTEIAKQCLEDTKKSLEREQGEDFDQSFISCQIAMHQSLHSKLKVFERHASPEVKPLVTKSLQTNEKHLKQAEALLAKIDDED